MTKLENLKKKVFLLSKLFRLKPVLAWSVSSFILVFASGVHDGLTPDIILALLALSVPIILQGIASHAINDLVDEKVDRDTDIEGTGRFKVLISGIASRKDLYLLSTIAVLYSIVVGSYIYLVRGYIILLLLFAGLFIIYAYNFKPFKLNYRPFAEYTTVFPVIILVSLGFSYSIFGDISKTIIFSSIINAMINVSWYFFSRLQDVIPDYKHGKMTTFAWIYAKNASLDVVTDNYNFKRFFNYISYNFLFYMVFALYCGILINYSYLVSFACIWFYAGQFVVLTKTSPDFYVLSLNSAYMRKIGMYFTYVNSAVISILLYF